MGSKPLGKNWTATAKKHPRDKRPYDLRNVWADCFEDAMPSTGTRTAAQNSFTIPEILSRGSFFRE